ncbi:MAG: ATP-binding protein [Streptosporangiaceae bacterium]
MAYLRRLLDDLLDDLMTDLPAILIVGPRGTGKTTTAAQRAASSVRLDVPAEAAAFRADPDAILRGLPGPVLIDEWQNVPEVFPAVKRAVDADGAPGRFLLTGSASGDITGVTAAGTGRIVRLQLFGMSVRERLGSPSSSIIDRLDAGVRLEPADGDWDIRGYLDAALRSGFPDAAKIDSATARERWLEGYVSQVTTRDATGAPGSRDPGRLRRFLQAYAVSSAGVVDAKTIYDAAGIDARTAGAYEALTENVFVTERVPAWSSNRLKRLIRAPKRYVVDAGLLAALLRTDAPGILRDGFLLGKVVETFVMSQLRAELEVSSSRPALYHLRDAAGRHEVDIVAELGAGRIVAFEVKAGATVRQADARHLMWLRDELKEQFVGGVVLHTGPRAFTLADRIAAAPISTLWAGSRLSPN